MTQLAGALRRSNTIPAVERLGGDGYFGFYAVRVGRTSWTVVLSSGEDRWYRIMTIARTS